MALHAAHVADLRQEHLDELAMLESLDNGKPLAVSKAGDVPLVGCAWPISTILLTASTNLALKSLFNTIVCGASEVLCWVCRQDLWEDCPDGRQFPGPCLQGAPR